MCNWLTSLTAIAAFAGVLAFPSHAEAWGKEGHDLVGKVADKFLTLKTRNAIDELLQDHQFKSLADGLLPNWADAIRGSAFYNNKYRGMSKWHFIDVDVNADLNKLKLADYCQNGDCALDAIRRFQKILKNPNVKEIATRREALFFIAHFVGDIHQPLHCADRNGDRGGNLVHVRVLGDDPHATNLHKVWDTDLVLEAMGGLSTTDYATRLTSGLSTEKRKQLAAGTLEDWVLESHKIARENAYKDLGQPILEQKGKPHHLSPGYMQQGSALVELQLTKGGVRLAQFLNDTFEH
jgi:hypothetical protein